MSDKSPASGLTKTRPVRPPSRSGRLEPGGTGTGGSVGTRYEDDVYGWALEQCGFLEARLFERLDVANLLDEVGGVARREFDKLESALRVLTAHMLKWDHQPDRRSRSWVLTIIEHRSRVADVLADSPGLKSRQDEALRRGYRSGRNEAALETGLALATFPEACPYDWDALMNRAYSHDDL